MAFFSAIGAAIAGALFGGSVLAATLISGGLAFAANLAVSYLTRPKKRTYSAVQGEVQFGGNIPAGALYGTSLVKGQRIFYAKYGKGNRFNAEVFVLSNGWCHGLQPEIYFYSKKYLLRQVSPIGNEAAHFHVGPEDEDDPDHFGGQISIRFYDGRPGQGVDQKLVDDTAELGRSWKPTNVCAGMCYVVVEREYNPDKFEQGVPEFGFVLSGLRCYDFRRDDTVQGGAGSHRVNDPATWAFTDNPAIQRLNYQLGLRGLISNRTIVGEGKTLGQLDLESYRVAANHCDTPRTLEGRTFPLYQSALWVTSDDDHTEVLSEWDDAMAGYSVNRRGLSGIIVGAPQIAAADITAADIPMDRAQELARRKSAFDLYNHMSGQFISREAQWAPESLKPVHVNADVVADGRARQTSNDFLQVTDPDVAQYLLNIRYRQNRLGGSAVVPVSRRLGFKVMEGNWVTFADRSWLITNWECDDDFNMTLTLAETSADIYVEDDIEPGPVIIPAPSTINPSMLTTVQNFAVAVGLLEGAEEAQFPTLRFTWDPPADPTITAVVIEYVQGLDPAGKTPFEAVSIRPESGEHTTTVNVISGVHYSARATIRTQPDRLKTYTPWVSTASSTGNTSVYLPGMIEDLQEFVTDATEWIGAGTRDLIEQAFENTQLDIETDFSQYQEHESRKQEITVAVKDVTASYTELVDAAVDDLGNAIVQSVETLRVEVDGNLATAVDSLQTRISTVDGRVTATSQAVTQLEVEVNDSIASATDTLQAQITDNNGDISAISTSLTSLRSEVDDDIASAVNLLQTEIYSVEGDVTAISNAVTALDTTVDNFSASGRFRVETQATPSGASARIGLSVSASSGGSTSNAALFLDALSGGQSRVVVNAGQFAITNGAVVDEPFIFQGGTAYLQNVRIGAAFIDDLTVGTSNIEAGAVTGIFQAANAGSFSSVTVTVSSPVYPCQVLVVYRAKLETDVESLGGGDLSYAPSQVNFTAGSTTLGSARSSAGSEDTLDAVYTYGEVLYGPKTYGIYTVTSGNPGSEGRIAAIVGKR